MDGPSFYHTGDGPKPPEYGPQAVPHVLTFSAILGAAWRNYWINRHDEAMKFGRDEALAMERDCYLMGLLNERKLGTSSLKWRIKVDKETDPWQKAVKDGLTKIIEATKRFSDIRWNLLDAIWRGRQGHQMLFRWLTMRLPDPRRPGAEITTRALYCPFHQPVNGDKIDYMWDGTPYVLINSARSDSIPHADTFPTNSGRALLLKGPWRTRFILHRHETKDADFFDVDSASAIHGVGIRSVLFWVNWLRQEWLANVADWCERTGLGVRLWYYQGGNARSKTEVSEAAKAQSDKTNILIPRYGENAVEGVDYVDTASTGADLLLKLQQHLEEHIERYVIGQTLSSGTEGSGLGGTGVASLHADTKSKIIAMDAQRLDDSLTDDWVDVVKRWTYPWADFPARFVSDVDQPDQKEVMQAVQTARSFGVDFRVDDVRGLTGMPAPQDGDLTLDSIKKRMEEEQMQQQQAAAMMGGGGPAGPPGGMPEGAEQFGRNGHAWRFWKEEDHPRGQPENAGEFAPKGGGQRGREPESGKSGEAVGDDDEVGEGPTGDGQGGGGAGRPAGGKTGTGNGESGAGRPEPSGKTKTEPFRRWFGRSKVVDQNGEPKETHSIPGKGSIGSEGGKPIVVYHGTSHGGFDAFRKDKIAGSDDLLYGQGFYFTEDRSIAEQYAKGKGEGTSPEVKAVYLSIQNPFDIDKDRLTARQLGLTRFYPDEVTGTNGPDLANAAGATMDTPMSLEFWRSYGHATGAIGTVDEHGDEVSGVMNQLNETIRRMGYDGLTHIGGGHRGMATVPLNQVVRHRVWIAFEPTQIKSTQNRGTFDPNDPRIDYARVEPHRYEAVHAPSPGVYIAGKWYKGGEFIPSEKLAKASKTEKKSLEIQQNFDALKHKINNPPKPKPVPPKPNPMEKLDTVKSPEGVEGHRNVTRDQAREALRWNDAFLSPLVGSNRPNHRLPEETRPQLDDLHRGAMQKYTRSHDSGLNAFLRGDPEWHRKLKWYNRNFVEELHDHMQRAFAAAPVMQRPVRVVRGMSLFPRDLQEMAANMTNAAETGETVAFKGYTSTTRPGGIGWMLGFDSGIPRQFRGNVEISIDAVHGLDMRPVSQFPAEDEFLINHDAKFKVKKAKMGSDNILRVHLEQLPPESSGKQRYSADSIPGPADSADDAREIQAILDYYRTYPEEAAKWVETDPKSIVFEGSK